MNGYREKKKKKAHLQNCIVRFVCASFEVCVNGPRRGDGRYPSAEAS